MSLQTSAIVRASSSLCVLAVACCALGKDVTILDPAKAGPDYAVQGEYSGQLTLQGERTKYGAQVVALGDSKFDIVLYEGGLPGAGWNRGDRQLKGNGATQNGTTRFDVDSLHITIADSALAVTDSGGQSVGDMQRVERQSETLGAKAPKGALVLFDGTTAEHFQNGKLAEKQFLMANCSSKEKFDDHLLHIEFRTPFKPFARGQGRGNSGVYVQSRYEVQVLDSFGLEGRDNECGGIYSIQQPAVNMCFPPLTWQTYDIDFTAARYNEAGKKTANARATVRHNGVVIHEDLELPHGTPGRAKEGPDSAPLYLQGHGNPVVFRNIWVVKK